MPARTHHTMTSSSMNHAACLALLCLGVVQSACVEPPSVQSVDQGNEEMTRDQGPAEMDSSGALADMGRDADMAPVVTTHPSCDEEVAQNSSMRFQSGTGEAGDPYIVCTPNQLLLISVEERERVEATRPRDGAFYELGQDIELDPGKSWTPIPCFRGVLDGVGHRIVNLVVEEQRQASGCYTGRPDRVGGFIHQLHGEVRDLTFEQVRIGSQLAPMPPYFEQTSLPYELGGLFGTVASASVTDVKVRELEAFVAWSFGGLSHTLLDASLSRVSMEEITIHYGHGHVGGLSVRAQNKEPNGLILQDVSIKATLKQEEELFGSVLQTMSMPIGLMTAMLHGAATLDKVTVGGRISHTLTDARQETLLGAVAGTSFDLLPAGHPEEVIEMLRTKKLRLNALTVRDVQFEGCETPASDDMPSLNAITCHTSGALIGSFGQLASQRGPLSTPLEARDVLIEDVSMRSANAGLLFGLAHENKIVLDGVTITNVALSQDPVTQSEEDARCLVSRMVEGNEGEVIMANEVCITQSTCALQTPATSLNCTR